MTRRQVAARVAHVDRERALRRELVGKFARDGEELAIAARRQQQAVVAERVDVDLPDHALRREQARELLVRVRAHREHRRRLPVLAAHRREEPQQRPRLPVLVRDRELRIGERAHDLRLAVDREVELLAEHGRAHPPAAVLVRLGRDDHAVAVDEPDRRRLRHHGVGADLAHQLVRVVREARGRRRGPRRRAPPARCGSRARRRRARARAARSRRGDRRSTRRRRRRRCRAAARGS